MQHSPDSPMDVRLLLRVLDVVHPVRWPLHSNYSIIRRCITIAKAWTVGPQRGSPRGSKVSWRKPPDWRKTHYISFVCDAAAWSWKEGEPSRWELGKRYYYPLRLRTVSAYSMHMKSHPLSSPASQASWRLGLLSQLAVLRRPPHPGAASSIASADLLPSLI